MLEEGQSFTIAKGRNARPELPARLKLEFDPNLRPGTQRPDGTIDFSSRGALTPVAEGDIINVDPWVILVVTMIIAVVLLVIVGGVVVARRKSPAVPEAELP